MHEARPPGPAGSHPQPTLRWWGTLLYPAALVSLFLGLQGVLALVGVSTDHRAALAAGPALLALLLSLPWRLRQGWGVRQPWQELGLQASAATIARSLLRGLIKSLLLLALVAAGLGAAGLLQWQPRLSAGLISNAVALGLWVGFAEELLFRGWLMGELTLLMGPRRGLLLQAALFSLVHTRFNLALGPLLGLLGGLLLLGLALGLQRCADRGVLWGAIGLHGGLVAGWFLLHQGLVAINPAAPAWLIGPANPIGGILGWLGLALLLWVRRRWW